MKIAKVMAIAAMTAISFSAHAENFKIVSTSALVQQEFEMTATVKNCSRYDGPATCTLSAGLLELPTGGQIIGIQKQSISGVDIRFRKTSTRPLMGAQITAASEEELNEALAGGRVKVVFIYQGPSLQSASLQNH